MMHFTNAQLSSVERTELANEEQHSLKDIHHALHQLQHTLDTTETTIPNKVIARVCKVVKRHHVLKFTFSVSLIFLSHF